MFNVQSKNRQEVSLVYCTNQTKRLIVKLKRIPQSSPESMKMVVPKYRVPTVNIKDDTMWPDSS